MKSGGHGAERSQVTLLKIGWYSPQKVKRVARVSLSIIIERTNANG